MTPDLPPAPPRRGAGFTEVADRVWVARQDWYDLNVVVVAGSAGAVVVDTQASEAEGALIAAEAAAAGLLGTGLHGTGPGRPLLAVVHTHEHHDHVLGTAAFLRAFGDAPVVAHEVAAARTADAVARAKASYEARGDDPRTAEVLASEVVVPDRTFSSATVLDLGDRVLEVVHPGRGHTAGDLVVRVPDADVLVAGDLVEESGPPVFGPDSHPLDWPTTLDVLLGLTTPASVVVPGHGAVVDRAFVEEQRAAVGVVAGTILDLAQRGVPVDEALAAADAWPYPREHLLDAVRRGYATLPRGARRLPLA